MGLADVLVLFLFTYYSIHIGKMIFNKHKRVGVQKINQKLDKLRKQPIKTLDQQKKFLDLKYPKTKWKWSWKIIPNIFFMLVVYIIIFRSWLFIWEYFNFNIKFWQAILIIIVFPLVLNFILEKFNIQKGDLRYMLRW